MRGLNSERGAIHWNPLRLDGTRLPETLLLAARLLAIVVGGYWPLERSVAMFDLLGELGTVEQFTLTLRFGAGVGILALLFTHWVRLGAALVGSTMLIGLLGALGAHSVAHTYLAAFFLIVSMSSHRVGSELLRLQLVVLYGGSALHKTFDLEWWNGAYFHTFLVVRHELLWLDYSVALVAMGIGTIVVEWSLAFLFARDRTRRLAVTCAVVFHASITIITQVKFGPFLAALFVSFLAVGRDGNQKHEPQDEPALFHPLVLLAATLLFTVPQIRHWTALPALALIVIAVAIVPAWHRFNPPVATRAPPVE